MSYPRGFSLKENLNKCTRFEEQKGTRYVFGCLLSTNPCLRSLLICFSWEIKGFFQSFLGNKVDFTDIMNTSSNILVKIKLSKTETRFCRQKSIFHTNS